MLHTVNCFGDIENAFAVNLCEVHERIPTIWQAIKCLQQVPKLRVQTFVNHQEYLIDQ
jgi:hypothetical protein